MGVKLLADLSITLIAKYRGRVSNVNICKVGKSVMSDLVSDLVKYLRYFKKR